MAGAVRRRVEARHLRVDSGLGAQDSALTDAIGRRASKRLPRERQPEQRRGGHQRIEVVLARSGRRQIVERH